MYKTGDKFIVEIGEEYETTAELVSEVGENTCDTPDNLYRIKGFNSLVFDKNGIDKLEKYENGEEDAYQRGLNDAWKCADKLNRMTIDDVRDVFSGDPLNHMIERECIFSCCTPDCAIEKIREYEEQKKQEEEIKVGDVIVNDNAYVVVTYVNDYEGWNGFLLNDCENGKAGRGYTCMTSFRGWKKTDYHYEGIVNMLKQMQEDEK